MNFDELFTADEAAAELNLTKWAVYNYVRRGALRPVPGAKRGHSNLFRLEDVFNAEKTRDHTRRKRAS